MSFKFPTLRNLTEAELKKKKDEGDSSVDETDVRFERALLLLQVEAEALGWANKLDGEWGSYNQLVVELPAGAQGSVVEFLDSGFAKVMKKAGFNGWSFPSGCVEPKIKLAIERYVCVVCCVCMGIWCLLSHSSISSLLLLVRRQVFEL